jgi:hypothetical protein
MHTMRRHDEGRQGPEGDRPRRGGPPVPQEAHGPDRYAAIDTKLQELATAAPSPPPWHAAWRQCLQARGTTPEGDEDLARAEERLAVWRAVRDWGGLPADVGFYLVAGQAEFVTALHARARLREIDRRLDAVWAESGFQELRAQAVREAELYAALPGRCPRDWDRLYTELLEARGEPAIARLYRADREGFDARLRAGRDFFAPRPDRHPDALVYQPGWLRKFLHKVAASGCFTSVGRVPLVAAAAPECREGEVVLRLSLRPGRVVGGRDDGLVLPRPFALDVEGLHSLFDEMHGCTWQPFDDTRPPNSYLSVWGVYRGHRLVVQVNSLAPDDVEPQRVVILGPPLR